MMGTKIHEEKKEQIQKEQTQNSSEQVMLEIYPEEENPGKLGSSKRRPTAYSGLIIHRSHLLLATPHSR